MQEEKKDNFSFIREQIKDKPLSKKRIAKLTLLVVFLGMVFGLVSGGIFHLMQGKEEEANPTVEFTIPEDETDSDEPVAEEDSADAAETVTDTENLVTTDEVETMIEGLGTEDYQNLMTKIYEVGKAANSSIVTVCGITSDTDFLDMPYEREGLTSGLILGDNGVQKLILTQYSVVKQASEIQVTFIDDASAQAEIIGYDENTDLCVVGVTLTDLSQDTLDTVTNANLGNSNRIEQGQVVLALGNPVGEVYSILHGSITSTTGLLKLTDGNCSIFATDMVGDLTGNGVLINLDGEVVGLYSPTLSIPNEENILTGVSLSQMKSLIEKLSNGNQVAYLGVEMTTITESMAEENDIPEGAYITAVEVDSPAFNAGLRVGDVITKIGTTEVENAGDVTNYLWNSEASDTVTIKAERMGSGEYKEVSFVATFE